MNIDNQYIDKQFKFFSEIGDEFNELIEKKVKKIFGEEKFCIYSFLLPFYLTKVTEILKYQNTTENNEKKLFVEVLLNKIKEEVFN